MINGEISLAVSKMIFYYFILCYRKTSYSKEKSVEFIFDRSIYYCGLPNI